MVFEDPLTKSGSKSNFGLQHNKCVLCIRQYACRHGDWGVKSTPTPPYQKYGVGWPYLKAAVYLTEEESSGSSCVLSESESAESP